MNYGNISNHMCVESSCGGNRHRRDAMWPLLSLGLERWVVTFASRTAFTWPPSTQRPGCMKMSLGQAAWASKKCSRCIWLTTLRRPRSTRRFSVGAWKTLWSMILPGAIATSKDVWPGFPCQLCVRQSKRQLFRRSYPRSSRNTEKTHHPQAHGEPLQTTKPASGIAGRDKRLWWSEVNLPWETSWRWIHLVFERPQLLISHLK